MKWFWTLFLCLSASAQLPIIPYTVPSGASRFTPDQAANALFWWFELTPTNGARVNTDGSGGVPANSGLAGSWINLAHNNDVCNNDGSPVATYFVSGGGANGTSPRLSFPNTAVCRYLIPAQGTITNFTIIMVIKPANATGNKALFSNGNGGPLIQDNAGKLEMNAGSTITGPVSIGTSAYIITWVNAGASSEIDTNGVLYVSGNSGTKGFAVGAQPIIAQPIVNEYQGDISRIWGWTNILSAGDMTKAINQCKQDFGFP